MSNDNIKKLSRWYFGGISSACAACVTHPLDLLKVRTHEWTDERLVCNFQLIIQGTLTNSTSGKVIYNSFHHKYHQETRDPSFV